jgi:lipoyl synthase
MHLSQSLEKLPSHIRVSLGTAITLKLAEGKLDAAPTTVYLMTYHEGKCSANCGFCPQAREAKSNSRLLSRVVWPVFQTQVVISALDVAVLKKRIGRVCIQALNYLAVFGDLEALVKELKRHVSVAVSVSCQPQTPQNILRLKQAGADRLGIALDAATEAIFNKVKGNGAGGCYVWENQFRLFSEALKVFGAGNVSTHVIVGLGESERDAVAVIERCVGLGVLPALFAFTPVRGTALEGYLPPDLCAYRRVQLARYLIVNRKAAAADIGFDSDGKITDFGVSKDKLQEAIESGVPFQTTGCPDCNRPYYNEKPSGPLFNYPKMPNNEEIQKIKKELSLKI